MVFIEFDVKLLQKLSAVRLLFFFFLLKRRMAVNSIQCLFHLVVYFIVYPAFGNSVVKSTKVKAGNKLDEKKGQ